LTGRVAGGKIVDLTFGSMYEGIIDLATDPAPRPGADHPEIAADGKSIIRITATLRDDQGNRPGQAGSAGTARTLPSTITFHTDRGALSRRTVDVVNGSAQVDLRSVAETVVARVFALANGFQPGTLTVEFIPPDELAALQPGRSTTAG
jgi:hypothetical protein